MARPLRLQLKRGITWKSGRYDFRRGTPLTIQHADGSPDEPTYHSLLRSGYVADPDQQLNFIHPVTLRRAPIESEVLVIRDMGLGDVLMVSVALRALAQRWPNLRITYATDTRYVDLFKGIPFLHRVVSIVDVLGKFSYVLDLRGFSERHPQLHVKERITIFGQGMGVEVTDFTFPYVVTEKEAASAVRMLDDVPRPTVALTVRGSTHVRTWPFAHVVEFARMAIDRGWGVVLVDSEPMGFPVAGVTNLTGRLGVRQLAAVLSECDLAVAPDTGIVHLAEAVGTPCVAIYSTIDPAVRLGHYQNVQVLWRGNEVTANGQKALPCCPCWDRGCKDVPCLTGITPAQVMGKSADILGPLEATLWQRQVEA